jgi:assimilatory nitrate reductase electron transfer subunit
VRKAAIVASWRAGARTVTDVVARTRATTGCGGCADAVCGIVAWLSTVDASEGAA